MRRFSAKVAAAALLGAAVLVGGGAVTRGAGAATTGTPQTITVTVHAPGTATYNTAFSVAANAVPSGLPVSFSSSGSCSNSGDRFQMTSGTGTCQVKYDQAGDATYNPAPQVVESVTAQKASQTIFFGALKDATFGDDDYNIAGAFTSSDLAVTFAATGSCTISGLTVHLTGAGLCTITATQAGDANYNAAPPVPQTFAIAKGAQEIMFLPLEDKAYGDPDFTVTAKSDSGLPVSFTASGRCAVRGSKVHILAPGACKVTASQAGNANYNAALSVSQGFSIARPMCSVPKVTGKRLGAAKAAITQSHCRTGKVTYAYSRRTAKGRVTSQSRRPGRTLPANSRIDLVVSRGRR